MEKINIVELLINCPQGMELDCTMFDGLELDHINTSETYPIVCRLKLHNGSFISLSFTEYGHWNKYPNAKCVIFPRGKTTWDGIKAPFKDGDVVSTDDGIFTAIVRRVVECEVEDLYNHDESYETYCHIYYEEEYDKACFNIDATPLRFCRLANEEEKERLFKAIKENGYKWNAETKTLEKSVSNKFDINALKPYDKVLVRDNNEQLWTADLFGSYHSKTIYPFRCVGHYTNQCVPYEGNEHLLGTTDNCDEFFKTWE